MMLVSFFEEICFKQINLSVLIESQKDLSCFLFNIFRRLEIKLNAKI